MSLRAQVDRLGDDRVDELDDRRLVVGVAQVDGGDLLLGLGLGLRDVVQARELRDQDGEVLARGDDRAHVEPGLHRDVVERDDVARVGRREQQRALVEVADRDGLVAARGIRGDEVRGVHVHREHAEVDVVDAEALGQHAGQLVAGERAAGDEHVAGRAALGAGLLDGAPRRPRAMARPRSTTISPIRREAPLRRPEGTMPLGRSVISELVMVLRWRGRGGPGTRSSADSGRPSTPCRTRLRICACRLTRAVG